MSGYHKLPLSENNHEIHFEHSSTCKCRASRLSAPDVPYKAEYFYNYDFNPSNGLLEFNDTGVPKSYAGYPTKEIDDAWSELLTGTYMEISKDEQESVQKAAPWNLEPLDRKVYMEVSVFHNLHYLDLVRKALELDHYDAYTDFTSQLDPQWKRVHIYHCINQLRQAIQCQSDLTPVPLFSVEGPQKKFFATHSVAHTRRDFDAVKKWGVERNKEKAPFNWNSWTGDVSFVIERAVVKSVFIVASISQSPRTVYFFPRSSTHAHIESKSRQVYISPLPIITPSGPPSAGIIGTGVKSA
ncbi:hypothetical protein BDZ45DRAFT_740218 [Acephala macrosclerotiorum]|nr:hypothetical protein BDZ45DRAFT_740218 [Acephala macrosclerotiorum]